MNNKYRELSQNTLMFTLSSFGSKFISFFLVPLYTSVLSTKEYGDLDLLVTTSKLLIPLLTLNIQDAVLRYSLENDKNKYDVIKVALSILGIGALILSGLMSLLYITDVLNISYIYIVFLFFVYITNSINNILNMYLKAKRRMQLVALCGIINTLVTCVANIFLLLVFGMGVNGYMIAFISGTFTANIVMVIAGEVFKDIVKGKCSLNLVKTMVFYSTPLVANSVAWWVNSASDRYILAFMYGTDLDGIYAVAYKIPSVLAIVQTTFYSAWSVSAITEFDKEDRDGFIGNIFRFYYTLSIVVCSTIMLMNIQIAKVLYANDFFMAWKYVPMLLMGTLFNGLGLFIGCLFTAVKRTKEIAITTVIGAAINTIINLALIPKWGAMGAAIATVIGYYIVFCGRMIKLKKIIRISMRKSIFIISMVALFCQCIVASYLDKWYYQIVFFIIVCVLNGRVFVDVAYKILKKIVKKK